MLGLLSPAVQKQTLGEMKTKTLISLPVVSEILLPKIIKIC